MKWKLEISGKFWKLMGSQSGRLLWKVLTKSFQKVLEQGSGITS